MFAHNILIKLCKKNDIDGISKIKDVDIHWNNDYIFSLSIELCNDVWKWILRTNPPLNIPGIRDLNFRLACYYKNFDFVDWLIGSETLFDIHSINDQGYISACKNGHTRIIKLLFEYITDPKSKSGGLDMVILGNFEEIVLWMIERGVKSKNAFINAVIIGNKTLSKKLYEMDPKNIYGNSSSVFGSLIKKNYMSTVKWLLSLDDTNSDIKHEDVIKEGFFNSLHNNKISFAKFFYGLMKETEDLTNEDYYHIFGKHLLSKNFRIPIYMLSIGMNPEKNRWIGWFVNACSDKKKDVINWIVKRGYVNIKRDLRDIILYTIDVGYNTGLEYIIKNYKIRDIDIRQNDDEYFKLACNNKVFEICEILSKYYKFYKYEKDGKDIICEII